MDDKIYIQMLRVLVIIVDRNKLKKLTAALKKNPCGLQFMLSGMGTATSELLDLLGFGGMDKSVVLCVSHKYKIESLLATVSEEMELAKPGRGIAFTMPLDGILSPVLSQLGDEMKQLKERMEIHMENQQTPQMSFDYSLVLAFSGQGFSDEIMEAAKSAGAGGGTVIQARRIGHEEMVKFFGISLQEEKEVIMIVVPKDKKKAIMQAISEKFGLHSDAKAMVLSLPVENIEGVKA